MDHTRVRCSVISIQRYSPSARSFCEPDLCVFTLRAVSFLASCYWFVSFSFSSYPFFGFDLDIVCFILSFSCEHYAVSSVSVSAATRLEYGMYLDPYARWSHLIFFGFRLRYTICFTYFVYHLLFFTPEYSSICFSPWGNLPLQSYWSLSCDHGLHCSDESMWETTATMMPISIFLRKFVFTLLL